jgi:hypothetical protein
MSVVVQGIHSNIRAHCGFKIEFQPIKSLVHILSHGHDIDQGMNLLPAEHFYVITELLEDSQYGCGIVKLGIWT